MKTPSNLSVVGIKPERIHVISYRLLKVSLPVEVKTVGNLPPGVALQKVDVSPASVQVLISPRLQKDGVVIRTKPIDLSSVNSTTVFNPELLFPPEIRFIGEKPPTIAVTIKVRSKSR